MEGDVQQKVRATHLRRDAYLYVRQSTMRQVVENTESTKRQYALRQKAVALGWPPEKVIVIDSDQGQSGMQAVDREGFQRLVAEVGMGHAGLVMGLEVSRLARNSTDWHRLLELCALTDTLILDSDGVYDPSHFNDRLLLGLKGTMSEAELHVLNARLRGGILNKARRGELTIQLPVGLVYNEAKQVVLHPDSQVQSSIRLLFETFRRTGSAYATVQEFRAKGILFPGVTKPAGHEGLLLWGELVYGRALMILQNPRYAGVFCFGRRQHRKKVDGGKSHRKLPREEWIFIPNVHEGYITLDDYEENQRRLAENSQARRKEHTTNGVPREGSGLLQGRVLCGICGFKMTVRYHTRRGQLLPEYICHRQSVENCGPKCQAIMGVGIDAAIGELLTEAVTPMTLDVALSVQQELESRAGEVDRLRRKQIDRTRYEADLAKRRYMKVDPDNRLVADSLEAEWNQKLQALTEAQQEYERLRQAERLALVDEQQRAQILALSSEFPKLWSDPKTSHRDRKRILAFLIEDVTLCKGNDTVTAHVRFRGGATKTLVLPRPQPAWRLRITSPEVISEITRLIDRCTDKEIAAWLNNRGFQSGTGRQFTQKIVQQIRLKYISKAV